MQGNNRGGPECLKLVMLGEGRVGKTSLSLRFVNDDFDNNQETTENASYLEKTICLKNGDPIKLALWDTAGQERFHALTPMYYRDALGAVVVYDITFKESFAKVQKWLEELKQQGKKNTVIFIAGNKSDMENKRQISKEEAEQYAKSVGAYHVQTSAKSNYGVEELFKNISQSKSIIIIKLEIVDEKNEREKNKKQKRGKLIKEDEQQYSGRDSIQIKNGKQNKKKSDKCC